MLMLMTRRAYLLAVELELVILGRLDGAVLGERADDGHGLVELGFDRHGEDSYTTNWWIDG